MDQRFTSSARRITDRAATGDESKAGAAAASGAKGAGAGIAHPRRWHALVVTQVAAFMTFLDVSIVNVALPSIERGLGASVGSVQWVVSGYTLAFGLALVPAGRLGDVLGRRRMFLIALSAFIATSALSGAASTAGLLIAARLFQGVAGGMLVPQNAGLIQDLFRGAERARAFGTLGATNGLAIAAGPIAGGLILTAFTGHDAWRYVFYVNVPIGLAALVLAAKFVPAADHRRDKRLDLDLVGALLLGGGVLSLLLPLVIAETGGLVRWWSPLGAPVLFTAIAGATRACSAPKPRSPAGRRFRSQGPWLSPPVLWVDVVTLAARW